MTKEEMFKRLEMAQKNKKELKKVKLKLLAEIQQLKLMLRAMAELIYWTVIAITVVLFAMEYTKGDDNDLR